jgi:N4-gp56 family major capsid protein
MSGQLWATDSLGGFLYSKNLSKKLRKAVQPLSKFRQFCDIKDASQQGKKKGDTFTWDVVNNLSVSGTRLTETNTIPETNFTIAQGTLTIRELGNSVPYTGKLDDLSQFDVEMIIDKALKDDVVKALDREAFQQFETCQLRAVASSGTDTSSITLYTNGTVTGTNTIAFSNNHAKSIVDTMKERNIPPYAADDYYALAWPTTLRGFKNNLETIKQYTSEGFNMIKNGEVGRYENVRYVEQTNIAKGITTNGGLTGTAWSQAKSDWIFFFGADTVAEAIAVPEEMRGKIPTDYGRSKGVAWYYLGGFGLCHTQAAESRVLKWDSQV